ncbi:MAG TPA: hypothetical protein VFZ85_09510 [Jiangellaceae bacterium]
MKRLWAAVIVAALPTVVALVLVLSWRERLPARLAIHWTAGDRPDGFTGRDAFIDGWAVASVAAVSIAVAVTLVISRGRRVAVVVTGAVSGFLASLGLLVSLPNLDLADPEQAQVGWQAALPIPLMIGAAVLAWWLHGGRVEPSRPATRPPAAHLPRLAAGDPARYAETATNWGLALGLFVPLAGLGIVVSILVTPWLGLEFAVLAAALAWFARARVKAGDGEYLTLSSGPIKHRVPIEELTGSRVLDQVSPLADFGGWGLRYTARTIALAQRRGPAVEAARTERRRVVVTCRDPDLLAAVLNTLADRRFGTG